MKYGNPSTVAGREHRDDVRLAERRGELDFALEALDRQPLRQLRRHDLDDHLAVEPRLLGDKDARHPAAAQFAVNGVLARQRGAELGEVVHAHRFVRGGIGHLAVVRPDVLAKLLNAARKRGSTGRANVGSRRAVFEA